MGQIGTYVAALDGILRRKAMLLPWGCLYAKTKIMY